jgi:hypothetical protein
MVLAKQPRISPGKVSPTFIGCLAEIALGCEAQKDVLRAADAASCNGKSL